ncbi:bile acid:sodium symporter family protein [Thiomicrorhabdus sp. ZW0627]|uniref:bile acid:sodium symporter family protein n=1 Tax=Thiomicrorhabdus sp. ZW0627 TaxID=3039774 RepID=UPI002436D894|nr:bile acid:sodium symporter family protein [Thiomicrorhabdus sp. ZW0627]MDG6773513.1 bile acid:sodium symporter family protein [Thiomicrorhabdus sp. ZW0627]
MSPDLLTKVILPAALFLIMFGMGLSLRLMDFKNVLQSPKAVGIGLIGQMILLPIAAFIIAIALNLSPEIAVGLMIIALAPGGATSNMFTYLSKGDVSLSISLTAVVSVVTPFTIPIIAALSMNYFMGNATEFNLPVIKTIVQLLVITIIPVALGMFVLSRWPNAAAKIENQLKWFSILFLLLIITLIVLKNADNMAGFFAQAGLATLLLNAVVLVLGYQMAKLSRLSHSQSVSIGFEVGIQNGTLALVVAGTLIGNEAMMIPAVTYSLLMFVSGAVFSWFVWQVSKKQAA